MQKKTTSGTNCDSIAVFSVSRNLVRKSGLLTMTGMRAERSGMAEMELKTVMLLSVSKRRFLQESTCIGHLLTSIANRSEDKR